MKGQILILCSLFFAPCLGFGETGKNCTVRVANGSANYFLKQVRKHKPDFSAFHMVFDKINVTYVPNIILPGKWFWTYPVENYLHWPLEFHILSLGLMPSANMDENTVLYMNTYNCSLQIGSETSDHAIGEALNEFSQKYLEKSIKTGKNKFLEYSKWCYLYKSPVQHSLFELKILFGYPFYDVVYRCCDQHGHFHINNATKRSIKCGINIEVWTKAVSLPYTLGLTFLILFPLLLLKFAALSTKPKPVKNMHDQEQVQTCKNHDSETGSEDSTMKDKGKDYVLSKEKSPVNISKYIIFLLTFCNPVSVIASRAHRLLFLLVSPAFIYIEVCVYCLYMKQFVVWLLENQTHWCFLGLIAPFVQDIKLSSYYICVLPYCILCFYYILGILVIVCPRNISLIIECGLPCYQTKFWSLLNLDIKTLQEQAMFNCSHFTGYEKIWRFLFCKFLFFFNPKNWIFCLNFQIQRWTALSYILENTYTFHFFYQRILLYIIKLFYVMLCLVEICLSIMFYLCPTIGFLYIGTKGYLITIKRKIPKQFTIPAEIVFVVAFFMFLLLFSIVLVNTFVFIGKIFSFVFLAFITLPEKCYRYLIFCFAILYYVKRSCTLFHLPYSEILQKTIEKAIDQEIKMFYHEEEDNFCNQKLDYQRFVFFHKRQPSKGSVYSHRFLSEISDNFKVVKYINFSLGIPRELFDIVIANVRPVYIQLFFFVAQIFVICLTIIWGSYAIAGSINLKQNFSNIIIKVGIHVLPALVQNSLSSHAGYMHVSGEKKRKIEQIVKRYYHKLNFDM